MGGAITRRVEIEASKRMATGNVEEVEEEVLAFQVLDMKRESKNVITYCLGPKNGALIPLAKPGQHLTLCLNNGVRRSYTISDLSDATRCVSISIKLAGVYSSLIHETWAVGTEVSVALPPRGAFVLDVSSSRHIVLLSAGIGITPMKAMLESALVKANSSGGKIFFIHSTKNRQELAFKERLDELSASTPSSLLDVHVAYTQGIEHAGGDGRVMLPSSFSVSMGRIDVKLLKEKLGGKEMMATMEWYICGPTMFMHDMIGRLMDEVTVPPNQIHTEKFFSHSTPALQAQSQAQVQAQTVADIEDLLVMVKFTKSEKEVEWRSSKGLTLLELAEQNGIDAPYSCRMAACGYCSVELSYGTVRYRDKVMEGQWLVQNAKKEGQVLTCSSFPCASRLLANGTHHEGPSIDL